jgi:hypothetical protein
MSEEYELATLSRDGLIYTKTELSAIGRQIPSWWEDGTGPYAGGPHAWNGNEENRTHLEGR